jgi:hypothetical protein
MSDPKNKWNQPAAPPPPMFFGKKERDLVKQVNDELSERVIGQPIAYYPISIEESNFNDTYGEAIEKVSLPPVRVYAYVVVENEQTNERYGYEYQTKLTVNFSERRITEDQNLFVRVGDFVQYGDLFYEIVRTYNDTRYYFGQVEHKFQISAECVRAREGAFRVMPDPTRPTERELLTPDGTSYPAPRPALYPSLEASYITANKERKLPNERVLTGGTGITITDGGAGGNITVSSIASSAQGPTGSLQLQKGTGDFVGDANLLFLTASNTLAVTGTLGLQGSLSASSNMSASYYYGDGRYLTGVTASATVSGDGPIGALQFKEDATGEISGSTGLMFLTASNTLQVTGDFSASVNVSASAFYGDGSNLSGITTAPAGANTQIQYNNAGAFSASADLVFDGDALTVTGDVTASAAISASSFHGDGSSLTGITTTAGGANTQIQFNSSGDFAGSSNFTFDGTTVSIAGNVTASANISASAFYGDGSNLTGITASAVEVADGPVGSLQFRVNTPVSGEISGSSNVLYSSANNSLTIDAGLVHSRTTVATTHTASVDSYILGVTGVPTEILFDATAFAGGQVLVIKDESGAASSANTITLKPSASQTIDGETAAYIESPYGSVLIYSNGTNWFIY